MQEYPLDPRRSAVIVFDMMNHSIKGDAVRHQHAVETGQIERFAAFLSRARGLSLPVVYVVALHRPDNADQKLVLTDQNIRLLQQGRPAIIGAEEGSSGAEVMDELRPEPGDILVRKHRRSAFHDTDLDLILRSRGVDTILVGGQRSDVGMQSTIRCACDMDYNVVLLSDCSGGTTPLEHEWALEHSLPWFSRVMTSEEALKLLGAG